MNNNFIDNSNNTQSNNTIQLSSFRELLVNYNADTDSDKWSKYITPQLMTKLAENFDISIEASGRKYNVFFIANMYLLFHKLIFEKNEKKFYSYDPQRGLWVETTECTLVNKIQRFILDFSNTPWGIDQGGAQNLSQCKQVVEILRGAAEHDKPFERPKDKYIIHTKNTMLEYSQQEMRWQTHDFSADYRSRNATEIMYDPEATAPRFMAELLQPAMTQEDIDILQKYVGQILLGNNLSQRFLMITGTAGGGKSTLVNVIEQLISRVNCTELRMKEGNNRFETCRYVGKTLLTAKDVSSQFLNHRHAGILKALTGGDVLTVEYKGHNNTVDIVGNFNIIIVSNSSLQLKLDNDMEAWRRRLLWIKYSGKPQKNPIADFDKILIEEEGSGILNWALAGAEKLLTAGGKIQPPQEQVERINDLLNGADPLNTFVKKQLEKTDDVSMTTEEIWNYFNNYCQNNELQKCAKSVFQHRLPELIEQMFGIRCQHNIIRKGKAKRGYSGISLALSHN